MRYILSIILISLMTAVRADPIVISSAKDTTVSCEASDVESLLTSWYNNAGGGRANDPDGGPIVYEGNIILSEAIEAFNTSSSCGSTHFVEVTYIAKDQNGKTADLGTVRFSTVDSTNPIITKVPGFVSYTCQEGIRDTFITWIKNRGGATASDNCSTVQWTRFIWNNTAGTSGTGSIDNGPYPTLVGGCTVGYNISFIAEDGCGNRKATTGRFSIIDDTPPIVREDAEITVSCDNVPDKDDLDVFDYCDPDLLIDVSETSTQSTDPENCAFYNYELTREYTIKDACQNTTTFTQKITVQDSTAPVIVAMDTIDVDCHVFDRQDTTFAQAMDNCSAIQFTQQDQENNRGTCTYSVDRTYIATDICGNVDSFLQHIRIRDRIPPTFQQLPRDTSVYCTAAGIQTVFDAWLQKNVSIPVSDGCNDAVLIAATTGTYVLQDTSTYPKEKPIYQPSDCDLSTAYAGRQVVDFIAYDQCGNATLQKATFTVLDSISPSIDNCPEDVRLFVDAGACTARYALEALTVTESCSEVFANITINDETTELDVSQTNTLENIPIGTHTAFLKISDCAGNNSSCSYEITVQDTIGPEFVYCGTDEKIILAQDSCTFLYRLQKNIVLKDACGLNKVYYQKQPQIASQESITFSISDDTTANNKTISFKNVFPTYFNDDSVLLTVRIHAQLDADNYYSVFGEDGEILGVLNDARCQGKTYGFLIDPQVFNTWATDGEVDISFIATGKITPCAPILEGDIDGTSRLSGVLSYSDAELLVSVSGATTIDPQVYTDSTTLRLNAGENIFTYTASDLGGNETSCSFTVSISDNNKPIAKCKNAIVVYVHPDGEQKLTLDPTLINDSSNDNCGEVTFAVSPTEISCDQINTQVQATLTIFDKNKNESTCTSTIKVEPYELKPNYSAGVCEIDTLRLFANAPASTTPDIYTYQWTGPNGFTSKSENPFIPNANDTYNGTYTVTVTGLNGCSTSGSVLVSLTTLQAPQITYSADTLCVGDDLVLNATTYTGDVTYEWYEGSQPDGNLLSTTNAPSFTLTPENGSHRYYVLVKSSTCSSTASNTITIMSIERPIGKVNDNFINVCEGASFSLGTTSFGPNYTYLWEGPNGFRSTRPLPEEFTDVQVSDAGLYSLSISAGSCISDTVTTRVNVFNKPTKPIITAGDAYCQGSTVSLTVNNVPNGDVYTWLLDGVTYTSENENSLVISNAQSNVGGSWQVIVKSGICTSDTSDVQEIIIDDLQDISVTNNGPACLNDTIRLFATFIAGASYSWSGPNDFTSSEQNPKIQAVTGEYTVTIRTGGDCEVTASTSVKINSAPTITALSNNSRSCMERNADIEFYPTVVPNDIPLTYRWTGPNDFMSSERNPKIKNDSSSINGIYTLEVINGACVSEPVKTVVDVTIIPDQPSIETSSDDICINSRITLSSSIVSEDLTYLWKLPNGQTDTSSNPILTIELFSSDDIGEYSLTLQQGDCSSKESEPTELNIGTTVSPPFFTTNSPVCLGSSIQLSVTDPKEDAEYLWQGPSGEVGTGKTLSIIASEQTAGNYKVQLKKGTCISEYSAEQEVVIIKDLTTPSAKQSTYTACRGASDLQICISDETYVPQVAYLLVSGTDTIAQATEQCILIEDYSALREKNSVQLIAQKQDCTSEASPPIELTLNEGELILANNDTYSSPVNAPIKLSIFENDTLPSDFSFEIIDEPTVGELDIVGTSVLFLPKTANGTSVFTYRVCDKACNICDDAQVKVVIGQGADCMSPTIITPNGDNINDAFVINCLEDNAFPDNILTIFNQWGDEVYSAYGYDNTWNAKDIPDGTYFYILDLGNGSEAIHNFLMIQR